MAKIGERLISGLKAETTNTSFDSFASSIPERSVIQLNDKFNSSKVVSWRMGSTDLRLL